MHSLLPEEILDNRYRLVRVIGAGTFGTVWCAEHLALRSLVAIKVLDRVAVVSEEMRARFVREAWAAAALRSPHVVQILDCGVEGDRLYIVMELLEGESLEQRLLRRERLSLPETERVVRHVARAMDRAHGAGIIHRDLKPGNIFIQSNDGDELIKVLDFGIAKATRMPVLGPALGTTPAGMVLGTPHYMSPEQVQGAVDLDLRTDIWSLGVIAFECLLGRPAVEGDNVSDVLSAVFSGERPVPSQVGAVPPGFDAWFARACARQRERRFESGKVAADEFARLCGAQASSGVSSSEPSERLEPQPAARATPDPAPLGAQTLKFAAHVEGESSDTWRSPPRSRRWPTGVLLGAAVALVAVWSALALRPGPERAAPPPTSPQVTELAAPTSSSVTRRPDPAPTLDGGSAPAAAAADSRGPGVISVPAPTPVPEAPASHAEAPPAPPRHATGRAPERDASRTAAPSPSPPRSGAGTRSTRHASACDPPWYFDQHGHPKAKVDCL